MARKVPPLRDAVIRWRIRIKWLRDGTCEAEVRTHQGVSLCKNRCDNIDEATAWVKQYVERRELERPEE